MRETVVIAGSLAQKPTNGGQTWLFLQYLLGFKRLGWDVLFLDRLDPAMCVDESGAPSGFDGSLNVRHFREVMARFGLDEASALLDTRSREFIGLSRREVLRRTRDAALLIDVMGFLGDEEVLGQARRRVFLDIDPGFGQMWKALGLHDPFRGYDAWVTLGRNIGQPDCTIPTCGLPWIPTSHPVVLEHWPVVEGGRETFTSIGAWRGLNGPLVYEGRTYGLRVHEFRAFVGLPRRSRASFELALDIHPAEIRDLDLLHANGWSLVDPRVVARTPRLYRGYVGASKAEFLVPKHIYVESHSGLVSDRSAYYLASGKPVVARDTGIGRWYPTGEGLLTFATLEEAAARVEEVLRDYRRHARAAREVAEACFDSDKVLTRLLSELRCP